MSALKALAVLVLLTIAASAASGQLILEDFDDHATGSAPFWQWWSNGLSGTIAVDEEVFAGPSGKSGTGTGTGTWYLVPVSGFGRE